MKNYKQKFKNLHKIQIKKINKYNKYKMIYKIKNRLIVKFNYKLMIIIQNQKILNNYLKIKLIK